MRRLAVLALVAIAGQALAAAPQPRRAVPMRMYQGRWYQVGQIVKTNRHPCPEGVDDFAPGKKGGFSVTMSCRKASGGVSQAKAGVAIVSGSGNAKFRISFFGGLLHQEYWVLDHADDLSWAVMATPGGNYLWLLARAPALEPDQRAQANAHISALGYNPARLVAAR